MSHPSLGWSEHGRPDGPPLLLGSSLGTTSGMWAPQLPFLDEFRVITFDHLGHGESQVATGPYSMQQLAGEVVVLLDHLGIARTSYAGLSLGGAVGQWLAIHHPERIGHLVLLATAAYFPDPAGWQERAVTVRREGTESLSGGAMTRWFNDRFRQEQPEEVERWRQMLSATPAEGYAGCCEALAGYDVRSELGRIAAPTLAIAGSDDPSTPPSALQSIADGIPGARLEVVEDAAHLVGVPHPQRVGELLVSHLRGAA